MSRNSRSFDLSKGTNYEAFLENKTQLGGFHGFDPIWMPEALFDFQKSLVEWAIRKGRAAIFANCGLGKTAMQLTWAENIVRKTNGRVLVLTPLSVAPQTVSEGEKFGIGAAICRDGKPKSKISVSNYERLHYFDPNDFEGVVCDESGCLKNFEGKTTAAVTEFLRKMRYRLLCTATCAPNDYPEIGSSSEAVGEMGYVDMLAKFFKNDQNSNHPNRLWSGNGKWRFRGHAERDFWRWVCSWARAVRKPSDLGFEDEQFRLPELIINNHQVDAGFVEEGFLFSLPASTNQEERKERRATLNQRCEKAAELINGNCSIAWCNLNDEGDLLEKLIPDSQQITGARAQSDEEREEIISNFVSGKTRVLIGKPSVCGFGLNFQHCAHQTFFPTHSFEQWYQAIRRTWRFGQKREVIAEVITSAGEAKVMSNLRRKQQQAEVMFHRLVTMMSDELTIKKQNKFTAPQSLPSWI